MRKDESEKRHSRIPDTEVFKDVQTASCPTTRLLMQTEYFDEASSIKKYYIQNNTL